MKYNWSDKLILFAEDDEASSLYLSELLKLNHASVIQCTTGLEALSISLENPLIDLVLMDMKLPGMDGFEATRMIKQHRPRLPIIAVTACAMLEDRRRCKIVGCDGYLAKPVMPKNFLPLVQHFLFPEKNKSFKEYLNYFL